MAYLEKGPWRRATFLGGKNAPGRSSPWKKLRTILILTIFFVGFGTISGIYTFSNFRSSCFDPYKGVISNAWALPPGKSLDFRITKHKFFGNFVKGVFPLDKDISIVALGNGEKLGTNLDPVRFAVYNIGREYLYHPAIDWIYPSLLLKRGKRATEALGTENLSAAFQVVPWRQFRKVSKKVQGSQSHMMEPFLHLAGMQGLEHGFQRKFADGKIRLIKPNDTWLALRPNTHGLWRRSQTDRDLGVPSLEPQEALPVAFYIFTELCNKQTGEWDIEQTQWLVSREYAISYGIYLDPAHIEIVGKGLHTRFLYRKDLSVDQVIVRWSPRQMKGDHEVDEDDPLRNVPVHVVNERSELCFWGSAQPDQSIFIPYSYLPALENDDLLLLSDGKKEITFQDILDELEQVRENRGGRSHVIQAEAGGTKSAVGYDLSPYVAITPRLTKIVDGVIGDVQTKEEAVEQIMSFIAQHLPYVSDHKGNKNKVGYNGPTEIPMSPLLALLNRGKDCDGHAVWGAAGFMASEHPTLKDMNDYTAMATLSYGGIGHAMPLLPKIGKLVTDPFPNHVILPVQDGKGGIVKIPFSWIEPTGLGENELHQSRPQQRGYEPRFLTLIRGHGPSRQIATIGFNQFQHLPPQEG